MNLDFAPLAPYWLALWSVGGALSACSSDDPRPPPLRGAPDARAVVGCSELQASISDGERLLIGGAPAPCVTGQACPLLAPAWASGCSDGGLPWAECVAAEWRWACSERDAGAPDAPAD